MIAKFVYESLIDVLKPKTSDEIIKNLSKLSQKNKNKALFNAIYRNNINLVKLLLDNGANINAKTEDGYPIFMSTSSKSLDLIELLIKNGVNTNVTDLAGNSPLDIAFQEGDYKLIELLKKYNIS